jgi:carboxyl-terminal processing protease
MKRAGLPFQADPGELKMTIRKFYRPDGASTQLKGVASDIVLSSPTEALKVSEAEMSDPLPWDRVPSARHDEWDRVAPWVAALREASGRRTSSNQDFAWLREDNDRIKKELANPVISLNEQQRRQEKAQDNARAEARKKERAGRPTPHETQYEITLKIADQPGLPKPLSAAAKLDDSEDHIEPTGPALAGKDLAPDCVLEETQHILLDYISMLDAPAKKTLAQALSKPRS